MYDVNKPYLGKNWKGENLTLLGYRFHETGVKLH